MFELVDLARDLVEVSVEIASLHRANPAVVGLVGSELFVNVVASLAELGCLRGVNAAVRQAGRHSTVLVLSTKLEAGCHHLACSSVDRSIYTHLIFSCIPLLFGDGS